MYKFNPQKEFFKNFRKMVFFRDFSMVEFMLLQHYIKDEILFL